MKLIVFFVFVLVFLSCGNKNSFDKEIVLTAEEIKEFKPILIDMYLVDALAQESNRTTQDSIEKRYQNQILTRHNITIAEYAELRNKYLSEPQIATKVFELLGIEIDSMSMRYDTIN